MMIVTPTKNEFTGLWEMQLVEDSISSDRSPIPRFFGSDGATIPTAAQPLVCTPYDPQILEEAIEHDWGYTCHLWSKDACDARLRDRMFDKGFARWKCVAVYEALKEFGSGHWNNSTADLDYIAWLKQKLTDAGSDPATYFGQPS